MNALEVFQKYYEDSLAIFNLITRIKGYEIPARVIRAWEAGSLLVPLWKDGVGEPERLWLNVVGHNVAVAILARLIAIKVAPDKADTLTEAALVHDWYKRIESEMISLAKAEGQDPERAGREAENISAEQLLKFGFSKEVVRFAKTTGGTGFERMMQPDVKPVEMIVFYADCCVDNTRITTYKERFDAVLPQFQPGGRYDYANKIFIEKYGMTHREKWDSVVLPIQEKLARLLGIDNPNALPILFLE